MDRLLTLDSDGHASTKHRAGRSHTVQLGDRYLLVDCGPASTYRLVKLKITSTSFGHHDHGTAQQSIITARDVNRSE